jgi:hypothetical protein
MWYKMHTSDTTQEGVIHDKMGFGYCACVVYADSFDEAIARARKEYKEINGGQPYDENNEADKILFKQARKIRCESC